MEVVERKTSLFLSCDVYSFYLSAQSQHPTMKIVVIGAGIIGTTTAVRLRRQFPDVDMRIVASRLSPDTTSDIAAGWWEPHLDPDTCPRLVTTWSADTYHLLAGLARGDTCDDLGEDLSRELRSTVRRLTGVDVDNDDDGDTRPPAWTSVVSQYQIISRSDVDTLGLLHDSSRQVFAQSYLSFTWEPSKVRKDVCIFNFISPFQCLPIFYKWLQNQGVLIEKKQVQKLEDIDADIVVNCTGLGAASLLGDKNLYPVSGHVLRVTCGSVGHVIADNRPDTWAYIIPNLDHVVLGSVDREDNWNTTPDKDDTERILRRCNRLHPGIMDCEIAAEKVGLRPCRRGGVRCELETIQTEAGRKMIVCHNYGHGGSGVTLSWGCAGHIVNILATHLNSQ